MGVIQTKIDLKGRINGGVTESAWLTAVPEGFRVLLRYVSERYSRPIVMVTENGMDRDGEAHMPLEEALNDVARQEFYAGYIRSMVAAVRLRRGDTRPRFVFCFRGECYGRRFPSAVVNDGAFIDRIATPSGLLAFSRKSRNTLHARVLYLLVYRFLQGPGYVGD